MKSILLFFFAFIFSIYSNAQDNFIEKDTIYSDENDQIIDKRVFNFKHKSSLFYGIRFENDTVVLNKLRFTYLFGEIKKTKKNQIFKLFSQRSAVDTTKLIVIHYTDTFKSIAEFPKNNMIIYNKDSTSHKHISNHKQFIKNHKYCIKNFKKNKKANVYHFYGLNNGHPENYKEYTWQKDHYKLIANIFSDSYKRFHTIIIRPDGNFFCFNNRKGNNIDIYDDIVKNKKWEKHKAKFKVRLKSLNSL